MSQPASHLETFAAHAHALYSRPTVAMELVRLAEEPRTDAKAIQQCLAQDPALVCKVLRVVNSSLYGLNRPVADLNQAVSLLGIKPLKMLVLGFSLPDALFAGVAARQLQWYWTNTLTRAVMARLLAEQLWHRAPHEAGLGDEAFTAALLQDIGILVLLRELGQPYAKFLNGVIDEQCNLAALERDALGFDHGELSAALLGRWQLPQRLVAAIAIPKWRAKLARLESPEADLPQILHLAELLMQLVGQRRLRVLGELLEAGKVYRGMTRASLAALVEGLQPQVDQLADVLALELSADRDYVRVLLDAHRQMGLLSEEVIAEQQVVADGDAASTQLLTQTGSLTAAVNQFLDDKGQTAGRSVAAKVSCKLSESEGTSALALKLVAAASRCRDQRQELSLVVVEPNVDHIHSDSNAETAGQQVRCALRSACSGLHRKRVTLVPLSEQRIAAILPGCERRAAIGVAQSVLSESANASSATSYGDGELATPLSVGVATASVVPRNFDPMHMIDSALRCLSAARTCGISTVKSIEV
jgi:HD-like signal output (HDOD) protein